MPDRYMNGTNTARCWLFAIVAVAWLQMGVQAQRVALLTNGNVLHGERIEQHANEVVISRKTSEVRLPARDVELVTDSLEAAFRVKSSKLSRHSSRARAELIHWCLRNDLRAQARHELAQLKRYDPSYPELGYLEKRVQATHQPSRTILPLRSPRHRDEQLARELLPALPRRLVSQFVQEIQPLMLNKCGQAGCHGKQAGSPFVLMQGRRSARIPQSVTHRNLGATLRRIENVPVEQTLLWMSAHRAHGTMKSPALLPQDLNRLHTWIAGVHRRVHRAETMIASGRSRRPVAASDVDPFDPARFNELQQVDSSQVAVPGDSVD